MLKVAGGGLGSIAVRYQGTWNANTNTPTLTSSVGNQGDYYVVSVAGNTNLNGITDWQPGDWAIFNGSVWEKVDNTETVYVSNVATGTGLTGGPITTTGTISLANTAVTAGVYGDAANVPQVTINAQGQATNVTNVAINIAVANVSGAVPNTTYVNATGLLSGGGQLTGNVAIDLTSVPIANVTNGVPDSRQIIAGTGLTGGGNLASNVTISMANTNVTAGTYGGGSNAAEVTVDAQGRITSAANVVIPQGTVVNINTGTGLTGGPITSNGTISIANTGVTSATYGTSSSVAQVTINNQGQVTNASNVGISIDVANVANAVPDSRVITAGTGLTGGGNLASNVTISMSNTNVTIGTYGGGTNAAEITVDQQGRITSAANVTIPQGTVTNVATGTGLTGGPITSNGTISLANTSVSAGVYGNATTVGQFTVDAQGRITSASNVSITSTGTVTNVATGTGLTGGPITTSGTISLANTAVSPGTYGSSSQVPQIIIDAQGRITSASNVTLGGASIVVTNVATVTSGSNVSWINNSSTTITWQNNSLATIGWTNNIYLATANNATILVNCAIEALTVQLPAAANVSGQQFIVKKIDTGSNAATISTTSSQKIDNANTYALSASYMSAGVQSDGSNYWVIFEAA